MILFPVVIIVSSMICMILFDYLVSTEFKTDKSQWVADGSPRGFFWYPRNLPPELAQHGRSLLANYRLSFVWLFHTPEWSRGSRATSLALISMRCLASVNILMIPVFIIFALLKGK